MQTNLLWMAIVTLKQHTQYNQLHVGDAPGVLHPNSVFIDDGDDGERTQYGHNCGHTVHKMPNETNNL